jgi:site-specific DNA-methyltransferase (adenine-specific)
MFPPGLPSYYISKYSKENEVVLDPFSGRGTTALEACKLGRVGVGNDRNPLAYLLTKAKTNVPQKGRIVSRIKNLEKKYDPNEDVSTVDPNIRMIYSDSTLSQLVYLKRTLDWHSSSVDAFIASLILGIMHGQSHGYLSLSMPNTFSMSPNYIKKYVEEHKLLRPERNVFDLLLRKLERVYEKIPVRGYAYNQDTRNISRIKDSSIDLIVTSPPYTRVITYGQYNWIRLWFLDEVGKKIDKKLFFSESIKDYTNFMSDVLTECQRVMKPTSTAVFVIGDVKHRSKEFDYNLAQTVWEDCAKPLGFKLKEPIQTDEIHLGTKVSKIWGEKKGDATKVDRILVLQR